MSARRWLWQGADMTRLDLEEAVVQALEAHGWMVTYHPRDVVETVYGTPGEPVIRGVHDGRALWLAARSHAERLSELEATWMSSLAEVPDAIVRVIRPDTLTAFRAELTRTGGRLGVEGVRGLDVELRRADLVAI